MSDTKFTSGPWNAVVYSGAFDQPLITSDNGVIARLHSHDNRQHEANAKLIASAPDMYEMLKEALDQLESWNIEKEPTFTMRRIQELINKVNN